MNKCCESNHVLLNTFTAEYRDGRKEPGWCTLYCTVCHRKSTWMIEWDKEIINDANKRTLDREKIND